jgi:hypothetical protein
MAYKKSKSSSRPPSTLPVEDMDKLGEFFVQSMLYTKNPDHKIVGLKTTMLWNELKEALLEKSPKYTELSQKFEKSLLEGFKAPPEQWLKTIPDAMEPFRRRADNQGMRAKIDMLSMWHEIAFGKTQSFDIPWLRDINVAEKFMPFAEKGAESRYVYKGFLNQALIAMSLGTGRDAIMVSKTDMKALFAHDFKKDPNSKYTLKSQQDSHFFAKLKGVTSTTSIYRPNIISFWESPDGTRYPDRKPSAAVIKAKNLREKSFASGFSSFPVWSVSDIKDKLSPAMQEKLKSLVEHRLPGEKTYFSGTKREDLHKIVDEEISRLLKEQGVTVKEGGNSAAYSPSKDEIYIPEAERFSNPIQRFSTIAHEVAHSTKHLLGRPASSLNDRRAYAAEELVAESTAYMMTKGLEAALSESYNGEMPEEWKECFQQYYNDSVGYNQGWGKPVSFEELFHDMMAGHEPSEKMNKPLERLMESVVDATITMNNGVVKGKKITPELRNEALTKNYEKLKNNEAAPLIDSPKVESRVRKP